MAIDQRSKAVEVARAHVEAWSNHRWDEARRPLADDVHVTATTTQPIMAGTDLVGVDDYMEGLKRFAEPVAPGSMVVNEAIGDDRNALLMVTVEAAFDPDGTKVSLTGGRLYQLNDDGKIEAEQVIFFASPK